MTKAPLSLVSVKIMDTCLSRPWLLRRPLLSMAPTDAEGVFLALLRKRIFSE